MIYLRLFYEFFKVGLFAVGGGMATVPFLLDISKRTNWYTPDQLMNMIAISESTPGPIGVNMSTYVGYTTSGIIGGLVASLALISPCIIIILIICKVLCKFNENTVVKYVFKFLRAMVIGLMAYVIYNMIKISIVNNNSLDFVKLAVLLCLSVAVFALKKVHPLVWIALGALLGLVLL